MDKHEGADVFDMVAAGQAEKQSPARAKSPGAAEQPREAARMKWLSSFDWPVTSIPHKGKVNAAEGKT